VKEKRSAMLGGGTGRGVWGWSAGAGMESSRRHWIDDVSRYDHQGAAWYPGSVLLTYGDGGTEAWVAFPCDIVRGGCRTTAAVAIVQRAVAV
jgi:hypothetical protein